MAFAIFFMMAQEPVPAYAPTNWWERLVSKEANRDRIGTGERIGNVIGIAVIIIIAIIIVNIQLNNSGLFTSSFGPVEQFLLYGSLLYGIVPSLVRVAVGKRNLGRFADLFGSLFSIIALSYFVFVNFPFDFTYLVTLLPESAQPSFSWFTNDLVKVLFEIGIVLTFFAMVYNAILYVFVRRELNTRKAGMSGM